MIEFPDSVHRIVKRAVAKHPGDGDLDKAVDMAEAQIRRLRAFEDIVGGLVRKGVAQLVHDARHSQNISIRKEAGEYGQPAKVSVGTSAAVTRAATSVYDYYIDGTRLGSVFGRDLLRVADEQQAVAEGHSFNARLCRKLKPLVADDKQVEQVVKPARLKALFKEAEKRGRKHAA
jgi:hypothetical protein